jgi:hypothetical protein
LLLETITDVEGGAHSLPELQWSRGIRRAGLPEPERQGIVQRADGRYYLDAHFDEWQTTVEINGAQHVDPAVRDYDDERRLGERRAAGALPICRRADMRRSAAFNASQLRILGRCLRSRRPAAIRAGATQRP